MGCTQSKIENEEAVTRCKERKEFMKKTVRARNEFASAHSAYTVALKDTGAALSDYSQGEAHGSHSSSAAPPPPPLVDPLPPPPPPLPNYPPPLLRATSMPEFVTKKMDPKLADTIQEEEDDDVSENNDATPMHHDVGKHGRHRSASGRGGGIFEEVVEVIPPPPPPPSNPVPPPPPEAAKESTWDYFFSHDMAGQSLSQPEEYTNDGFKRSENVIDANVVVDDRRYDNKLKRTENVVDADVASTSDSSSSISAKVEIPIQEKVLEPEVAKPVKKVKLVEAKRVGGNVASNVNLLQILNELDDKFLMASQSAHRVSKLLEANRMHYHSNFADNRGHIDHSARLMRVITWNRSIKGLQNTTETNDDDFDADESLASVLDKLLAWEKKLYDEVKAGELMKIEYQRKVASLNKRNKDGAHSESLEKAKAAVGHLHTRYIVDIQSMDSTVSEISHLRDDHLYPKLVLLVDGMAGMWETMHAQHRAQMKIVEDLRSLDVSDTPNETSEEHHLRTIQLGRAAKYWHSQFRKLMTDQKDCIVALNSWLKLNLIPIESNLKEKVSSPPRIDRPPIQALLHAWHENLERLPDELARSAIYSFSAILDNIRVHQEDEVKLKTKCEETRKNLARKSREFDDKYQKYMERRMASDGMDPDRTEDVNQKDPLGELQIMVETLKQRLKEEEEAHQKHCRQVREKSLASLKTHLPELFRAMSDFSFAASAMYKTLVPPTHS